MDYENPAYKNHFNNSHNENLKDACRTCLKSKSNFISVFSSTEKHKKTYAKIIMEIAPVVITPDQKFSTNLCTTCADLICTLYNFQQQCIEVDSIIRFGSNTVNSAKFIKREKSEPENNDTAIDILTDEKPTNLEIFANNKLFLSSLHSNSDNVTINEDENNKKPVFDTRKRKTLTESIQSSDITAKRRLVRDAVNKHSKGNTNNCDTCNKTFKTRKYFLKHIHHKHVGNKKTCDVCGKTFFYKNNLLRHKKTHAGLVFMCELCGKKFTRKFTLAQHIFIHTNSESTEKTHKCNLCNKWFTSQYRLQVHNKNCHSLYRKRVCELCNQTYSSISALNIHKASTHNVIKSTQSTDKFDPVAESTCECGKAFKNVIALKRHKKNVHSNQRQYQCTVCGDSFAYISTFNSHVLLHKGEKPFKCKFCLKKFRQIAHVKSHERIHTGEKPFTCELCMKSFRHRTTLTDHLRTHTGEKPYRCDICNKSFNHLTNMKKHKQSH